MAQPPSSPIGRFERIRHDNLDVLSQTMIEQGIYSFRVTDLQSDGKKQPATERNYYHPLVRMQPFNPLSAKLIGVDIAAGFELAAAIETSTRTNDATLVNYPDGWTQNGDVLMIHPTYLGRYVSDTEDSRLQQSRGGFVFEIDISGMLELQDDEFTQMDVSVHLQPNALNSEDAQAADTQLVTSILERAAASSKEKRYFSELFKGIQRTASPTIGSNVLLVEITSGSGVSAGAVRGAAIVMLAVFVVILLAGALVRRGKIINALHQQAEKDLENEREAALVTLRAIADAVITIDDQGAITYANPATERLLKKSSSDLVGKPISSALKFELQPPNLEQAPRAYSIEKALGTDRPFKFPELRVIDSRRTAVEVDSVLSPLRDTEQSRAYGAVLAMRDVSAERKLLRELEYQATHDSLTKIANRHMFEQLLHDLVDSSIEQNTKHALCFIDLDKFKIVNDTCGHPAGDKLLIQVADGIQKVISENDTLARLGGDEFGLLIRNCPEQESEAVAQRVYEFFNTSYFQQDEHVFPIRASIGFVHIDGQFSSVDTVMEAADLACYYAKDNGRNTLYKYNSETTEDMESEGNSQLMPKLLGALEDDNFSLALTTGLPAVQIRSRVRKKI